MDVADVHALNRMRYRVPLLSSKAERCYEVDIKGRELQASWPRFPYKFGASRFPRADSEADGRKIPAR